MCSSDLPPVSPPPFTAGPLDRALLERQLAELAEMLYQKNLKAEKCFSALRAHLGDGEWSEAVSRLEQQIDSLDFAAARKTLEELALQIRQGNHAGCPAVALPGGDNRRA